MKSFYRPKGFPIVALLCAWITVGHAEFWLDGKICGKPARLMLDTGSEHAALWWSSAQRLGFPFPPANHQSTQKFCWKGCRLSFPGFSHDTRIDLLELPDRISRAGDGLLGWREVCDQIMILDALKERAEIIKKLPKELDGWTRLKVRASEWGILALEVSKIDGAKELIIVDTGSEGGLGLAPEKWGAWKASHNDQPVTFNVAYYPCASLTLVREQAWAKTFPLGAVQLSDVLVEEADPLSLSATRGKHAATLGMKALKRLDLIVDGRHGFAYLRAKSTTPPSFDHNRLGAVFESRDAQSDEIVARVGNGSPAYDAGMRNGDIVLKCGEFDVTRWREIPGLRPPISPPPDTPVGTKMGPFTVRRGNETLVFTIVARDILAPEAAQK